MSEVLRGNGERQDSTVLDEVLAALERGEEPDPDSLKASHPGREEAIDRLIAAARRYFSLVRALEERARPSPTLEPGGRLGDFEIVSLLGRGGEGEVYRARQLSLGGRLVALKVISPAVRGAVARSRFEREAMILADLHHPHLAEVHGFGEDRGFLFLAMRLVEGVSLRDLQDRLRRAGDGPPDREARRRIVRWIAEVSDALAAVHAKGLVHRDVKPSNILVEDPDGSGSAPPVGQAVLVDFGLARSVVRADVTRTGQGAATPEYAPPEQLIGSEVDARADVFALGATLHDLLTGRLPGERSQASAGLEPLEGLLADVDRDLFAVVGKAVEIDPRRRYPDGEGFHRDLCAWQEGGEVSARRQNLAERVIRWSRAHPRPLLKAAGGAALGLLAAFGLQEYGRYRGFGAEARRAYGSADLAGMSRAAKGIPALLRPLLLGDPDLARAADAIAGGGERSLAGIVRLLDGDDFEGALLAAATELRVHGASADPLVERFFLSALRGEGRSPGDGPITPRRSAALRLAARLLYESPAHDRSRLEALAPLRAAVLDLFSIPSLPGEDRLFALTALSGCGIPQDVPWLLEWTLAQPESSEGLRLGLACCERMLRRAHRAGQLARLDLPALCMRVRPLVADMWQGRWAWGVASSRTEEHVGYAVQNLASAIAYAMRAVGEEVPWMDLIPRRLDRAAEEDGCAFGGGGMDELFVLSRRTFLAARVRSDRPWRGLLAIPYWLGFVCGLERDESLARLSREGMENPNQPMVRIGVEDAGAAFEEGRERGRQLGQGENPPFLLDEDTLLGSVPGDALRERVLCRRSSGGEGSLAPPWATWDFTFEPFVQEGAARRAVLSLGDTRQGDAGRTYLRLGKFRESDLRLSFEVAREHANRRWRLDLGHLAALRAYYPFSGEVFLAIRLDGKLIDGRHRISGSDSHGRWWVLPADLMSTGEHELSVRLDGATTTTYRVEGVRLRQED